MMLKQEYQVKLSFIFIPQFLTLSIAVYLGVNKKKVDNRNENLKGNKQYEYGVQKALANPGYFIEVLFVKSHSDIIFPLPQEEQEQTFPKSTRWMGISGLEFGSILHVYLYHQNSLTWTQHCY